MQRPQEDGKEAAERREELGAYQEVTPEEAADVLELMEEHKPLLDNPVAFAEQLSRELQGLEEVRSHGGAWNEGLSLWASAALPFTLGAWSGRNSRRKCREGPDGGVVLVALREGKGQKGSLEKEKQHPGRRKRVGK